MRNRAPLLLWLTAGLFAMLLSIAPVRAATFEEALALLTTDGYSDTDTAIGEIVASGSPQAQPIIEALADGRLMFHAESKSVFIKDKDGKLLNAATGEAASNAPKRR